MSDTTDGQHLCLESDRDGDVVLRYSKLEFDIPISFRVSSKVLRLACPVFARMLSPSFKEGHELLQDDRAVIELEDDDPSLMELIMNILHYQADGAKHAVDAEKLARLAIHCDKHDRTEALSPWAATWFMKLEEKKSLRPKYGFQLPAAYFFNDPGPFSKIRKAATSGLAPRCPAQWSREDILA